MTRRELIDWIDAAVDRRKEDYRDQQLLAYNIGQAFAYAYASVKGAVNYPSFNEMFPKKLTPEEEARQIEVDWRMHRDELVADLSKTKGR